MKDCSTKNIDCLVEHHEIPWTEIIREVLLSLPNICSHLEIHFVWRALEVFPVAPSPFHLNVVWKFVFARNVLLSIEICLAASRLTDFRSTCSRQLDVGNGSQIDPQTNIINLQTYPRTINWQDRGIE